MRNVLLCFVRSLPLFLLLVIAGYAIAHLFLKAPQKLDFVLFTLGAIPIILFLPGVFNQSRSGALHTPKVIFRKVDTLEQKQQRSPESVFPALSYVIAGVLTWLYSVLIF